MGLRRRTNSDGSITWQVRIKHHGREIVRAVGPSKREAQTVEGKLKAQIREGKFFDVPPGQKMRYGELLDRYLEHSKRAKRPGTHRLDQGIVKQLRPVFGDLSLPAVTRQKVLTYLESLIDRGLAPATANYHLAILRHSFTMAVRWELLRENPLSGLALPASIENERNRYLLPEEYKRLLAVCSPLWQRIIKLAAHTGLRKGQIFELRWDRLDLDNGLLRIPPAPGSKKKQSFMKALNSEAVTILREIAREQGRAHIQTLWVFHNPQTGKAYRKDSDTAWYTALKKAGIEDFHFHDLRHTFASWLRMAGVDLLTIKEELGHTDLKMTQRYAHISPIHRREAIERLVEIARDDEGEEGEENEPTSEMP